MRAYVVFLRVLAFFALVATLRAGDFLPFAATPTLLAAFGLAAARGFAEAAAFVLVVVGVAASSGFFEAARARGFFGSTGGALCAAALGFAVARRVRAAGFGCV